MRPRSSSSWTCLTRDRSGPGEPSRLANWPPPFRDGAEKPTVIRYVTDQERDRPTSVGFRLTRGSVSGRDD